ncbi:MULTISPECIES: hypothetical protein [unclassified Chryseobacterium]|uniref:hypothetical protein n=1 Tax=unclassified Chryseobacterium TaxID=2593645 RepID=UPI00226A4553|nr:MULTISPECIES: hypothetical protein [unclassified Chryseobacterium]
MKNVIFLILIQISTFCFAQSKFDKADINDFKVNNFSLIFSREKIIDFEKDAGKLSNSNDVQYEKIPFSLTRPDKILRNDSASIYLKGKLAYVSFVDLEKTKFYIKYKTKTFSYSTTIEAFRKIFPISYRSPSTLPSVPKENAVGYTILLYRGNKKAYLNFTFYYNHLSMISISDKYIKMTN